MRVFCVSGESGLFGRANTLSFTPYSILNGNSSPNLRPKESTSLNMSDVQSKNSSIQGKLVVAMMQLLAFLPLSLGRSLGSLLGVLNYRLNTRMATTTRANIRLCYPQLDAEKQEHLIKASLKETCSSAAETSAVWLRESEWVFDKILKVHNQALLDDALASGQGLILIAPHLGNWEVAGYHVSKFCKLTSLYQPPAFPELEAIMSKSREKTGASVVPTTNRGIAQLLKILRNNGVTGILPDQVPDPSGGCYAPFFGNNALTMTLLNNLRKRSGAKVIGIFAKRVKNGFEIHIEPAAEGIDSDDELTAVTALNQTVENLVGMAPEQYQWEYKRFRRQPKGIADPYKSI